MIKNEPNQQAVELTGLTKRFKNHTAVSDISLTIPAGTAFGFLGQNGAGKTTTLKMLIGLLRPSAGEANVLGHDPVADGLHVKQHVGYVPEQQTMHRWMRVHEAVRFCRSVFPTWNDALCSDLLKRFNLEAGKRVKHLSKGMVVKLSLVLALSHEPELILLDEPMAGLDPIAREELIEGVLQILCDRAVTLVFSSHTLSDVQRLADTVGMIHEGRLLVHRPVDDLLAKTKRIRAVLADGAAPAAQPDGAIWHRVQNREWLVTVRDFGPDTIDRLRAANPVETVEVIDLGLEEIFKDYVKGWRASS